MSVSRRTKHSKENTMSVAKVSNNHKPELSRVNMKLIFVLD